jgi:hypothetical protein
MPTAHVHQDSTVTIYSKAAMQDRYGWVHLEAAELGGLL